MWGGGVSDVHISKNLGLLLKGVGASGPSLTSSDAFLELF